MECGSKSRRWPVSHSSPCVEVVLVPYGGQADTRWDGVMYFVCLFQVVLVKSREQVADELSRLQRDNESLQGKHRLHVELQQQEDFQMPNTVQVRGAQITSFKLSFSISSRAEYRTSKPPWNWPKCVWNCQELLLSGKCIVLFSYSLIQ